jgi:hypothetical protein
MVEANGGHFGPAKQLASHDTAVTCDNLSIRIYQHRHVEAEGLDASGDLANLFRVVRARIFWIELEL